MLITTYFVKHIKLIPFFNIDLFIIHLFQPLQSPVFTPTYIPAVMSVFIFGSVETVLIFWWWVLTSVLWTLSCYVSVWDRWKIKKRDSFCYYYNLIYPYLATCLKFSFLLCICYQWRFIRREKTLHNSVLNKSIFYVILVNTCLKSAYSKKHNVGYIT